MRSSLLALALALVLPGTARAVDTDKPPEPTPTTMQCTGGKVWDHDAGACVDPAQSGLNDEELYEAAREFASAGLYHHALGALRAMDDQRSDRVMTYMGFALRKSGATDEGMAQYRAALAANPGNLTARSYYGQGLVAQGDLAGARAQLAEIRARGGAGGRPEAELLAAIRSGATTY